MPLAPILVLNFFLDRSSVLIDEPVGCPKAGNFVGWRHGSTFHTRAGSAVSELASSAGTDTESLVRDAALRLLDGNGDTPKAAQHARVNPLPVWHLGGVIGSLHRRDI